MIVNSFTKNVLNNLSGVSKFIDKIGFPIIAFMIICIITFYSMERITKAIEANTVALSKLLVTTYEFQQVNLADHRLMLNIVLQKFNENGNGS